MLCKDLIKFLPKTLAELSHKELEFVGGLLNRHQPHKILEIGVAAGGTSAFLLHNTGDNQNIYSCDIANTYYRDGSKAVGWQMYDLCSEAQLSRHHLFCGKDIIEQLPVIGGDIDFCIMDTNHDLPGEMLQFFAVYPFLKKGAVVIMHDISLNMRFVLSRNPPYSTYQKEAFATRILFTALGSRQKILPNEELPNIGAVIIDEETEKYLESTIMALGISWHYYPSAIIPLYEKFIEDHYSPFCHNVFKQCVLHQKKLAEYTS